MVKGLIGVLGYVGYMALNLGGVRCRLLSCEMGSVYEP